MFSLYNGINSETNNRTICGKYLNIWKLNNTFLNDSEIKEETNKKLGSIRSGRSPEEEKTAHSSILAWEIPWMEGPGGLQSTGSQRVGHD